MHTSATPHTVCESPLRLVPVTIAAVQSELAADGHLSSLLHAEVTREWPPADWERHVLELLLETFTRDPAMQAFHRYVLLQREQQWPVLVGCLGGFVWPDRPHELEIGYSILPAFRRRGYALDAARQYVAWVRAQPEPRDLVAQTFPTHEASLRILRTLGFAQTGPGNEPGTIAFRLPGG